MTSHSTLQPLAAPGPSYQPHGPLRIRLSVTSGHTIFDGAWWPRSRNINTEVADLVDHSPI